MRKVYKSNIKAEIKRRIFVAKVETVLVYGSEPWTITITQEIYLNGCYTHILRMVNKYQLAKHMTNEDLYAGLGWVSYKIRKRRLRQAGHCVLHPELGANPLVHWEQTQGTATRGRPCQTHLDTLKRGTQVARSLGKSGLPCWAGVCGNESSERVRGPALADSNDNDDLR